MTDTELKPCPLGDDCDLTIAYFKGFEDGKDALKADNARLRDALQNFLNGAGTGAITSNEDETFENAIIKARQALKGGK